MFINHKLFTNTVLNNVKLSKISTLVETMLKKDIMNASEDFMKNKKQIFRIYGIILIVLLVLDLVVAPLISRARLEQTSYSAFLTQVEKRK